MKPLSLLLSLPPSRSPHWRPVFHHYSAFQNLEGKTEDRDTRIWKQPLNLFHTKVSVCFWHFQKHPQLFISTGGKYLPTLTSFTENRQNQLLFNIHEDNECNLEEILCSLSLRIFPHSVKSLKQQASLRDLVSQTNWHKGLFAFQAEQV